MSDWTEFRDTAEAAAVIVGNYYFPGSSMITKHLVSDGAEEKLDSDAGRVLQLGSGGFGASDGNMANWVGGDGGTTLPSFGGSSGGVSGLDLGGPGSSPASWMGGGETVDPNAVSGIDLGGPGSSPSNTGGTDWAGKAQNWAKEKVIEKGIEQAVNGSTKQQQPADDSGSTTEASDKAARRQALMEKAQRLREQIAALRAQSVRESAIPQTVLGNSA